MIARAIRLLLASGFLAAVAHVAPVAERAALGISHGDFVRVEDLAPEAIARPLGEIRAACRIGRLSHRLESPSESGDACGLREPSSDARAQPPGTLPNPALTPGAVFARPIRRMFAAIAARGNIGIGREPATIAFSRSTGFRLVRTPTLRLII